MATIYVLLGTNLGNKELNLNRAINYIEQAGLLIVKKSSVYNTTPWGFTDPENFYNQVICINTRLLPEQLLSTLTEIEKNMGRIRTSEKYEARLIDLDILFYDDRVIQSPLLTIPHPRLHLRRFTLEPLCEIEPTLIHPVFKKTIQSLLEECTDTEIAQKIL